MLMPTSQQDTEITLSTGWMLGLFFVFVLVCAVFFSFGFLLGRKTTMAGFNSPQSAVAGGAGTARPAAGKETPKTGSSSTDFSFYKTVGSNGASTELTPSDGKQQPPSPTQSQPAAAGDNPTAAPVSPTAAVPAASGSYFVQVAAVSRQEDADALVEALKKKQYPAFAANNSGADKYYHIQVGPYAEMKDAEAMRARLVADGYNPIVKK